MLMTIEDVSKVEDVKKFAHDNNITINWEKNKSDGLWIEVNGDVSLVNKLYGIVLKINRHKSNFFTKIKHKILQTFEQFTQKRLNV